MTAAFPQPLRHAHPPGSFDSTPRFVTTPDLGKLSIDRSALNASSARRRRLRPGRWIAAVVVLGLLAVLLLRYFGGARSVETVNVTTAYPAQSITRLNATGYVVAQRQASIASKATGRLEWLGVSEGSQVKQGEVIARLENRDVGAKREQAAAGIKVAQANIEQARAELRDAQSAFQRSEELIGKHFISASAHDAARARFDKARAGLRSQQAELAVAQANYKAADVEFNQTLIRAPLTAWYSPRTPTSAITSRPFPMLWTPKARSSPWLT